MAYQSPLRLMRLTEVLDLTGEVELWLRNPVSFTLADLERYRDAA